MPDYIPPRRLLQMRQTSPKSALMTRPPADGSLPEIVFDGHSPTEFRHEHFQIRLKRRRTLDARGVEQVSITAQAFISVASAAGQPDFAADLVRADKEVEEGLLGRPPQPGSREPWMDFPPYVIVVPADDEARVKDMLWRALHGAVSIADRCLDVARQIALHRVEQIAQAEGR